MEEDDLLTLVARGRVKFHESDEFLCWQGNAYTPFLFVIQQGTVSLWEEAGGKEYLRDIRGPGDMIGIERYLGSPNCPYSAKATEEVVVYALPAADFEPLLRKYPPAARYVEAHSDAGAVYRQPERTSAHEKFVAELASHPEPLSCEPDTTVPEAARRLHSASADAIAVMQDQKLQGLLTSSDVLGWVANGGCASQKVAEIMSGPPPSVAPQSLVSHCVLAMARAKASFVALTADGTPAGALLRLVSAADLQPAFGDNPAAILQEIRNASDVEVVRVLHLRARAFLLESLATPFAIDWLAELADCVNTCVMRRLLELAGVSHEEWCWCFWGAAGRQELLTPIEPGVALLCMRSEDVDNGRLALDSLRRDLLACGYRPSGARNETLCATLSDWQQRFSQWIRDPILSKTYEARPFFDLKPAFGNLESWGHLEQAMREEIQAEPAFQSLLANDCMSQLPPLTFFENAVVDESGERAEVFELTQRALGPIVEVGRVFALAHGHLLGSSTLQRLAMARTRQPAQERIFREAMETFRVVLYLQAREGLRHHTSGAEIAPQQLSRFDRQALKTGFRAIHKLLELAASQLWTEIP